MLTIASPGVFAAEGDATIDQPVFGIAGAFKVGCWTPVAVSVASTEKQRLRLAVDLPDPEGSPVSYRSEPFEIETSVPRTVVVLCKMGRLEGTARIRLLAENRLLVARQLRIGEDENADCRSPRRRSTVLVAHVHSPSGDYRAGGNVIDHLNLGENDATHGGQNTSTDSSVEILGSDSGDILPTDPAAFASLDVLLLTGRFSIDVPRSQALERWVRSGGKLVLTVGKNSEEFSKSPLATWVPAKVSGTARLRELSGLESYCRQSARILRSYDEPIETARLAPGESQVLASSLEGPLVVRAPYGFGQVTVLAIDAEDPRISQWAGAVELLRRLFDLDDPQSKRSQSTAGRLTQTGITELSTQLGETQDDFNSVSHVTTWSIMGLLLGLLIVIGPVDYFLVHKVFKRPELTWVTFPAIALAGAALAVLWGTAAKGDRLQLNQLDVVDVDARSGWTRGHSYALFYSPENRRYNIAGAVDPAVAAEKSALLPKSLQVGWHGKSENAFGGMYRPTGAEFSRPAYSSDADKHRLNDVPIAIWSTKSIDGAWDGLQPGLVQSELESRGPGHLGGTFRHHFSEPLEDWLVAYGRQVFYFDAKRGGQRVLPPSIPWAPQAASQRELSGYLTGTVQRVVAGKQSKYDEMRTEQAAYDPLSRDPVQVMRMLTFHSAAGGTSYTGLGNGALRSFDLSPLLDLNRAVLVGRIRHRPLAHWNVNGAPLDPDKNVTFVRLVLPVRVKRVITDKLKGEE